MFERMILKFNKKIIFNYLFINFFFFLNNIIILIKIQYYLKIID